MVGNKRFCKQFRTFLHDWWTFWNYTSKRKWLFAELQIINARKLHEIVLHEAICAYFMPKNRVFLLHEENWIILCRSKSLLKSIPSLFSLSSFLFDRWWQISVSGPNQFFGITYVIYKVPVILKVILPFINKISIYKDSTANCTHLLTVLSNFLQINLTITNLEVNWHVKGVWKSYDGL